MCLEIKRAMNQQFENNIQLQPIYIEIYSPTHFKNYLQRREIELTSKSIEPINQTIGFYLIIFAFPFCIQILFFVEQSDSDGDDFHDLPSNFDDNSLFLDENLNENGDMEFLRNTAKNLMSSLNEMEEASSDVSADSPLSLLYGDDFVITIKTRRFSLAFLDYTQFRVEKQHCPERYNLLKLLKKLKDSKKHVETVPMINSETPTTTKKKRTKRNRKKKSTNNEGKSYYFRRKSQFSCRQICI